MPSDDRVALALAAVRAPLGAFQATLAATADEIRGYLATRRSGWETQVTRIEAELGPLAAGRVDPERFASLFADHKDEVDAGALEALEGAVVLLTDLAARRDALCLVEIAAGGSLYGGVAAAFGEIGRAFAAAALVTEIRRGRDRAGRPGQPVEPLPFSRWTRAERRLAPPLVVRVEGRDARAAALAEFLDGRAKIVLVIDGECPPAPLARLIGPGTFVVQTGDGTHLDRLAAWDGPGIAAIVPESAARFVHDPAAGPATPDRIRIDRLPDRPPRRAVGGFSAAQQSQELELLRTLATPPPAAARHGEPVATAAAAVTGADPAEKLAAWLLSQADLSDLK
jgi:hypothetical protein